MKKIAVIIYGPPGSGKGTQANLLADKLGLIHFDTGKFLEAAVHDSARQKEKTIRKERKLFDEVILMSPSFVLREVKKEVIGMNCVGLVFSGSPRTVYEAGGLYPILEKLYGRKNIFIFVLKAPAEFSLSRNSSRLVCRACGYTLLSKYYPKVKPKCCPVCGGPFYRRTLDKPEVIKTRLEEYRKRTKPVIAIARKRGHRVHEIDARPAPYKVFEKIFSYIPR